MPDKLQSIPTNSNIKLSLDVHTRNRYDLNLLLKGSVKLNADENLHIFAETKKFLRLSILISVSSKLSCIASTY